jgi:RNA polymerase sigma factor (sigma-70 family)
MFQECLSRGGQVVRDDRAKAFEEAYDSMRLSAYRAAYRLLGHRPAAEDVAGEALARAYSRWSSVSAHAEAWVVTVATNLALDIGRQQARAARRGAQVIVEQPIDHIETRLDLQAALRALPRRQREVVALRFLGDFSEQATAAALGLNVGTVKSHAARGLSRLRMTVERV